MSVQRIHDLNTPIGTILETAGTETVLLKAGDQTRFAVLPLDEDLLDYLIERSPRFREECRQIRERMADGRTSSHQQVRALFADDATPS